jgi:hypothetical protein
MFLPLAPTATIQAVVSADGLVQLAWRRNTAVEPVCDSMPDMFIVVPDSLGVGGTEHQGRRDSISAVPQWQARG